MNEMIHKELKKVARLRPAAIAIIVEYAQYCMHSIIYIVYEYFLHSIPCVVLYV